MVLAHPRCRKPPTTARRPSTGPGAPRDPHVARYRTVTTGASPVDPAGLVDLGDPEQVKAARDVLGKLAQLLAAFVPMVDPHPHRAPV